MKKFILTLILFVSALKAFAMPAPVNQVFQFQAATKDAHTVALHWTIAPGYYLYRKHFSFTVIKPKGVSLGKASFPKPIQLHDHLIGNYKVYENGLTLHVPVQGKAEQLTLKVHYQGCSSAGFCYPPQNKTVQLDLTNANAVVQGKASRGAENLNPSVDFGIAPAPTKPALTSAGVGHYAGILSRGNIGWMMLSFIGFGLLLAFTPCVLPMLPIVSSIVVGKNAEAGSRAFSLCVSYVLGMAVTYAVIGLLFGWIGASIQPVFQSPWTLGVMVAIFILMGLSMLGLFELRLPHALETKLTSLSNEQKRGNYFGVFVMGILATLIVSPCVTAPLVGVLSYVAQSGDALTGMLALFCLGLGVGVPILLIGLLGKKVLPKAGNWMNVIKIVLAFLLFAVAISLLARVMPPKPVYFLWALLGVWLAVVLKTFTTTDKKKHHMIKAVGVVVFVYAILLADAAWQGAKNPWDPISFNVQRIQNIVSPQFTVVKNLPDAQAAIHSHPNQIVMLDFYANWCLSCKEMDKFTFGNAKVQAAMKNMVRLRADVTKDNAQTQVLEKTYGVVAPPTILFFRNGKEIPGSRIVGEKDGADFLQRLNSLNN